MKEVLFAFAGALWMVSIVGTVGAVAWTVSGGHYIAAVFVALICLTVNGIIFEVVTRPR